MSEHLRDPLQKRHEWLGTLLAILCYVFLLAPIIIVVPIAFGSADELSFPPRQYSLDLFHIFFNSASWTAPLFQSLKVAVINTAVTLLTAVPAAYGLARYSFPGKRLISALMFNSLIVPTIVTALGLYLYFSYLHITGTTLALVLGHVVHTTPFVLVIMMAGVRKLDPNLEFGAQLLGAGRIRMLISVVLPQLLPSLIAAALFAFLISFDEVVISWFLSGSSTTTLPVKMFSAIRWEVSPVIAAVSTLLTAVSLVVCLILAAFKNSSPIQN
ncbi:ABC transporter permease [Mesorhizobium sp. LNJC394B00]|uniref:ABC transporter permease n=1 Tax=Mesorhizobium sp. LNJC394B00 TaxID=1287274 RepID=UPI0003CE67BD|nr:ABC transporter permease [Mesorhizobium sp. LNJC394B00]ESY15330.1 spermidine/putrescine ABC transporter permease [Mesorhizobium sp. LNJC394B00]